jgi:hypothetical protein
MEYRVAARGVACQPRTIACLAPKQLTYFCAGEPAMLEAALTAGISTALSGCGVLTWHVMSPQGYQIELGGQMLKIAPGVCFWTAIVASCCTLLAALLCLVVSRSGTYQKVLFLLLNKHQCLAWSF